MKVDKSRVISLWFVMGHKQSYVGISVSCLIIGLYVNLLVPQPDSKLTDFAQTVQDLRMTKLFEPQHDKTNKMSLRPVWSESLLCAQWVAKDPSFLHVDSEDSDQTGRIRPVWSESSLGAHAILLVLSCCGSFVKNFLKLSYYSHLMRTLSSAWLHCTVQLSRSGDHTFYCIPGNWPIRMLLWYKPCHEKTCLRWDATS